MPAVPFENRVQVAPIPGARLTVQSTPDTFGAAIGEGVRDVSRVYAQVKLEETHRANQVATVDANNQLSMVENELSTRAFNTRGKAAIGEMPSDVLSGYDKAIGEIEGRLSNGAQKQEFRLQATARKTAFDRRLQDHVAKERFTYDTDETKALIVNSKNMAAQNYQLPSVVDFQVGFQEMQLKMYADRNGIGPEELKQSLANNASETYGLSVAAAVNSGNDLYASEYFEKVKDKILPKERLALESAVKEAQVKGESRRLSANLSLTHESYSEAKAALDDMKSLDDDVKDKTKRRLEDFYRERASLQEAKQDADFESSYQELKNNGGRLDTIPLTRLEGMDSRHREGIERLSEAIRQSKFPEPGSDTYFNFLRLAENPALHDEFIKENVELHRADMSPGNFNELKKLDIEIRARKDGVGAPKTKAFDGLTTKTAVLDSTLRSMGLDPKNKIGSEDEDHRVRAIQQQFDRALSAQGGYQKEEVTTEQMQKIADSMLEEVAVTRQRSFVGSAIRDVPIWNPFGVFGGSTYEEKVRRAQLPGADRLAYAVGQVPDKYRAAVIEAYRSTHNGAMPPDDYIINDWNVSAQGSK